MWSPYVTLVFDQSRVVGCWNMTSVIYTLQHVPTERCMMTPKYISKALKRPGYPSLTWFTKNPLTHNKFKEIQHILIFPMTMIFFPNVKFQSPKKMWVPCIPGAPNTCLFCWGARKNLTVLLRSLNKWIKMKVLFVIHKYILVSWWHMIVYEIFYIGIYTPKTLF